MERIKEGKSKELIKQIRSEKNKDVRQELKKSLPAICFSGTFNKRSDDSIIEHSGFICLDFDGYKTKKDMMSEKGEEASKDTSNIKVGVNSGVYSYDAIGSFHKSISSCIGRGRSIMEPILDNLTANSIQSMVNNVNKNASYQSHYTTSITSLRQALTIVKEVFLAGAEREISVGDSVDILVISKRKGLYRQIYPLPTH